MTWHKSLTLSDHKESKSGPQKHLKVFWFSLPKDGAFALSSGKGELSDLALADLPREVREGAQECVCVCVCVHTGASRQSSLEDKVKAKDFKEFPLWLSCKESG